ncbi:DUF6795 domain-containing protein [Vibrio parahaemolyticus]|uniref:DUF6795 domain-containing protein n=1 Tax=Vibrio parahaemolyticus TaxID=670 RepID=UPI0009470714|nr:DUF6795 domain-containing protein [Vibrio parahaemolyticus]MBE3844390.1 DUF4198 domain-containing protein [Vibrio parahaemolyticus]MBE4127234.1 DUF4198 domain-containing protein [Vibrio parahaemolyticus]MBE4781182.1 DUF4198 domain-containing protein [Vibrio parahaemolyticus]MEA5290292.1 DUF6795 domain-containing protein [Vibrio parahaemolyticus]OLF42679.1 hypothetical protein BUQ66_21555 [Vibrio parahaemolyticus]
MAKKNSLILVLALFSVGASAMFWPFKKYDVEMSPEVRGVIKLDGKPQVGLTVHRELFYEGYKDGEKVSDVVKTNSKGEFYFPEYHVRSRSPKDVFGQNFVIAQEIYTKKGDKDIYLWNATKQAKAIPLVSDLMSKLVCDLNQEKLNYELRDPDTGERIYLPLTSICRWQGIKGYTDEQLVQKANELKLEE